MRICRECLHEKPIERFSKDSRMKSGYINTCKDCINGRAKYRQYRRNWEVQKEFGISLAEYNERKTPCEICGSDVQLHLDHNHSTKQLRGFLCVNCNMGIGQFKENTENMKKAIQYLEKYNG